MKRVNQTNYENLDEIEEDFPFWSLVVVSRFQCVWCVMWVKMICQIILLKDAYRVRWKNVCTSTNCIVEKNEMMNNLFVWMMCVYIFTSAYFCLLLLFQTFICIHIGVSTWTSYMHTFYIMLEHGSCSSAYSCVHSTIAEDRASTMIVDQKLAHSPIILVRLAPNTASKRNCKSRDAILKRSRSQNTHRIYDENNF